MTLAAIKVLLTRPAGQSDGLARAIASEGGHSVSYPVMRIEGLDEQADAVVCQRTKQLLMNLDHYQQVIFISTNAVHYGMAWIEQYWPQLPTGIEWHAIGTATGQALTAAGVSTAGAAQSTGMNSEALLQHASLQVLDNTRILIVRGVGGREYLGEQLRQRGARVDYAECYQRSKVERPAGELAQLLQRERVNCLLVNSGETLDYTCQLPDAGQLKGLPTIVPGERVAGMARERGFSNIVVASNASTDAIMVALAKVAEHQK
jgi:uroporphyrinogen-III synthase